MRFTCHDNFYTGEPKFVYHGMVYNDDVTLHSQSQMTDGLIRRCVKKVMITCKMFQILKLCNFRKLNLKLHNWKISNGLNFHQSIIKKYRTVAEFKVLKLDF